MMESGLMHILHSVIITIILYLIMIYGLKQPTMVARDRSILIGALFLVYMILFGHHLPTHINKNIY
jgi:purine-cytosine permease-like protein